ncbi:putative two-component system response regulator [Azospirillaceae bacterium]
MPSDDPLIFADDNDNDDGVESTSIGQERPWRVLVVDDDLETHSVTRLALRHFHYRRRLLDVLSAHSAQEARVLLRQHTDIALILLDVVMETNDAGLRLIHFVRHTLNNPTVRIILRTDHKEQIPEEKITLEYDINDYREKTELTQEKLFSCITRALRSYEMISSMQVNNQGLRSVIAIATSLFRHTSVTSFLDNVIAGMSMVMSNSEQILFCARQTLKNREQELREPEIYAGMGTMRAFIGQPISQALLFKPRALIEEALTHHGHRFSRQAAALFLDIPNRWTGVLYCETGNPLSDADRMLLDIFGALVSTAFGNLYLLDDLRRSNKATVLTLADLAEYKDSDTGEHVLRVARLTGEIANQLRRMNLHTSLINDRYIEQVALASILHDIGKVGIPDHILKKPSRLDDAERAIMETHTQIGGKAIAKAKRLISNSGYFDYGHQIALCHHEKFDGSGYPNHMKGEEIPLAARIVAVADVFDALTSQRTYKHPWTTTEALAHIRKGQGAHFDPKVVEALCCVLEQQNNRARIEWASHMSIGHPQLDDDHRAIITLLNQLSNIEARRERSTIELILDELVDYTLGHFQREEAFMESINFPGLPQHRAIHTDLSQQVSHIQFRVLNGLQGTLGNQVLNFMTMWWRNHILENDIQYYQYHQSLKTPIKRNATE